MKRKLIFLFSVFLCMNFLSCAGTAYYSKDSKQLDKSLLEAAKTIDDRLAPKSKVALLSFKSPTNRFAEYVIYELEANLLDIGNLLIIDRQEINLRRNELNFQMSGEVSDSSMKQLGRTLGAEVVVSGSLADLNGTYRLVLRVLNVESGTVITQYRSDITNDSRVRALLGKNR